MAEVAQQAASRSESKDSNIATNPVGEDEGYDYEEFVEVVHAILWDILDQRRPLLRRLINAKRLIDVPPPPPKSSVTSRKTPVVDGNALLEEIIEEIFTIDEELRNVDSDILREQLFRLCSTFAI
ncbi:uncharacterized protein BXIN_1368 [Babesia sp. Xinjiang]|uniref:uncharacterized protein n=1 Tax=Babesia sp. Xinjiang TaxID=462227 RepID=UPI000A21B3C9|nr:uncharacterized protein BXIN_1368 [Babesia sp. Xinjiang]ORM40212.1 hypothetical protein BXIN_1368 [Babesia sp. Xinjiang]